MVMISGAFFAASDMLAPHRVLTQLIPPHDGFVSILPDLMPCRSAVRCFFGAIDRPKVSVGLQEGCLDDGLSGLHRADLHQLQPHLGHGVQHRLARMGEDHPLPAVLLEEADDAGVVLAVLTLVVKDVPTDFEQLPFGNPAINDCGDGHRLRFAESVVDLTV